MSPSESDEDNLRRALKEQFTRVEAYCNAQTVLQNALADRRDSRSRLLHQLSLKQATLDLSKCTEQVQDNLKTLSSYELENRNSQKALLEHVARSKRMLDTIYRNGGLLSPLGIPVSKDDDEIKIVALATLRASMVQVEQALG